MPARRAVRVRVRGTVQGVGFRPFVFRLARSLSLSGHVRNDDEGVWIEAEGEPGRVAELVARLTREAPALARIDGMDVAEAEPTGESSFAIVDSGRPTRSGTPVTPDAATCDACLAELFDPADRRYRYPFINCTDCGPRLTIVTGTPYDRPLTTIRGFTMCPACRAEYDDPSSRRFHAQPNACPACGPRASLLRTDGDALVAGEAADPVAAAARLLRSGRIVAVKGIGGYHLACRADDEAAVARLRRSKHREEKPFAVMVTDLDAARALADIGAAEAALLASPERPIVLVRRRPAAPVADPVAPGAPELGLMLPYSPLHHLLFADVGVPLVMTSGNLSDEPIAHEDDDAARRLATIADALLVHDRPIHIRTDDSVARIAAGAPVLLRRSRGYVPLPMTLPVSGPPLLACGAQMKSTFCVADGTRAFLGHHIGDLENFETLESYRSGIEHFLRLFRMRPEVVAHDLHPDYLSTKHALARTDLRPVGVQHHHAHLAACLAEHGETGPALGAIFDGTGYGTDGTVWGGELLVGDLRSFTRPGRLRGARLPGGAAAIRAPWRMACAWLCELDPGDDVPALPPTLRGRVEPERWGAVARLARSGLASPLTTSMGRLFDAASALCGVRTEVTYEGQAAIELERTADRGESGAYELAVVSGEDGLVMDPGPALRALLAQLAARVPVATVAARFHNGVADATRRACAELASAHGVEVVALSGGVFQNVLLLERVVAGLERVGLRTLVHRRVPPNDGGIAFGQAAVAAARSGGS
ncbi:MAG: carbamoyltransferase HypF [Gemmatimonadetes bacterium]|nr:carbamoyltransferase HypF [Gemmatimonadota bacterium]